MSHLNETCPNCSGHMEMYYKPWCPRCDKPELKSLKYLNYIQCARHVAVKYGLDDHPLEGYERCLWIVLIDSNCINNDTFVAIDFPTWFEEADLFDADEQTKKAFTLMGYLIQEFNLDTEEGRNMVWEISW